MVFDWYINVLIVLATFTLTEFSAWAMHRYVMHGFLWYLHKDHHYPYEKPFQKNDAFFLVYAIPSWLLIMFGMMNGNDFRVWIGVGIALYGLAYFLVHDVFIHQRFKWFKNTDNAYFRAIRKAHKVHHKVQGKHGSESFGMLLVAPKFFKSQRS